MANWYALLKGVEKYILLEIKIANKIQLKFESKQQTIQLINNQPTILRDITNQQ